MNEKIIVGMGEALWDILPEGKKIGGAPANFAYHVSLFGLKSCVVSAAMSICVRASTTRRYSITP